ncbi:MAG TPA: outer membrane beta-barrel protein [Caulobacteraceae bacterium]|nr:outer membrane beta-barrel protein [Caulobacteraceae bacterium]
MKKTIFAASAAIALLAAMPAAAQDWYAQINAGMTVSSEADVRVDFVSDDDPAENFDEGADGDIDNGFAVGAAAGVALGGGLRVEGEFFYTSNDLGGIEELDIDDVEMNHAAFFANVLYDFQLGGVSPYIGAGVGYGSTTFDIDGDSVHDEDTAWQVKAGATFPVNDSLTIDVGYRYMDMAAWENDFDVDLDEEDDEAGAGVLGLEFEPTAHAITVGARFKLGGAAS